MEVATMTDVQSIDTAKLAPPASRDSSIDEPLGLAIAGIDPRAFGLHKATYTVREATEVLGFSRATLYKEINAGRLIAFKHGGTRRFLARDLAAMLLEIYLATRTKSKS
jgi:excisionase family DNA binding protein